MAFPKILVSAPIYDGVQYCLNDFINHLRCLDYPNFDVVLFDNSISKKFFREVRKIKGIKVFYDDTTEEKNILRLISSRNKILEYAQKSDYDFLLMLDADVMVPENLLNTLLSHEKDVVSGLYFNYFNVDKKVQLLPVCYKCAEENLYLELKDKGILPDFVKSRFDLRRNLSKQEIQEGFQEVLYPSNGCLLLSKKAFSSGARYGLLNETQGLHTSDDIYFFKELQKRGFKLYCDPSLICKHNIAQKYSDGKSHLAYSNPKS